MSVNLQFKSPWCGGTDPSVIIVITSIIVIIVNAVYTVIIVIMYSYYIYYNLLIIVITVIIRIIWNDKKCHINWQKVSPLNFFRMYNLIDFTVIICDNYCQVIESTHNRINNLRMERALH